MHAPVEFFRNRVSFTPMLAVSSSSWPQQQQQLQNVIKDVSCATNDKVNTKSDNQIHDNYESCALGCCYGDLPYLQGCSFLCVSPRTDERANDKTDALYFFTQCISAGQYVNLNTRNYNNNNPASSSAAPFATGQVSSPSSSHWYERYSDVILTFQAPLHLVNACGAPVHVSLFTRTNKVASVKPNAVYERANADKTTNCSSSSTSSTFSYSYLTSFNMNVIDQCNHRHTHHTNCSIDSANDSSNSNSGSGNNNGIDKSSFSPLTSSSSSIASE